MDNLHYEKFADGTVKQVDVPFEIPESWEWVRLSTISSKIHYGYTASAKEVGNAKLLRITDIQNNQVNWETVPYCDISLDKLPNMQVVKNDILIARTGGTIGKSFLIQNVTEVAVFASYLIRVQMVVGNVSDFVKTFIESPNYWVQLQEMSMGTGQPNVNATNLSTLLIPVAPIAEQERIFSRIDELERNIQQYSDIYQALEKLNKEFPEKLRKSILQYAMQGKLVPQNPNDEPVEVLLEKIRQEKQKLYEEGKLKKKDLEESIIYKGDDNSYYEKSGKFINLLEVPFTIPNKWSWQTITNVSAVQMGQSPKGSYVYDCMVDNSVEFHQGKSNFGINVLEHSGKYTTHITKFISAPSIVMSVRAPVGDVNILSHDIVIGRGIAGITPYSPLYLKYEYLFLKTQKSVLEAHATGSTFKAISSQTLNDALIPIPPINEQIRIVSQVEKFYSCIVRLES
ncbi:restriction endonuclease subunit S [Lactococcus lactis]|uniref:Restriction endonuclease subunit S n=1 Tax=Lactococcus lactis TaxID=1358 RepID=A0AAW8U9H1_9LACT|nr:restriction endonuclease subunit S [Lactococcus lactis]MDT2945350.1 restriction endonuclease subunit S [Lactococcus lactis]